MKELKYFSEGTTEHVIDGLTLAGVFCISILDDGKVEFIDDCDGYFTKEFDKGEAIELLQEAIEWIKLRMSLSNGRQVL